MQSSTRAKLIDSATHLVRSRGYSAFSYADLSEAVGIRKASIHHHFAAKADLGVALVAAYAEDILLKLTDIDRDIPDTLDRIAAYAALYRAGLAQGQGCLCGVLAAELGALPPRLKLAVRQFFLLNLAWLKRTLAETDAPDQTARTILSTVQGALTLALALGDPAAFDQAEQGLLSGLRARQA